MTEPGHTAPHVRFAPSPTGRLHPGNARTALVNALFARRHGGRFTLRIDDTDPEREVAGAVDAIRADLRWLGIEPDDTFCQGDRSTNYAAAMERLRAADAVAADGSAWRLRLAPGRVAWRDAIHGEMVVDARHLAEPVLLRGDGLPTYTLASVVDDLETGVTHVIRGDDHLTNTAVHLRVIEALGGAPPVFAHLPLVSDADGAPLSKRNDATSLARLRDHGVEPEPLAAYLVALGTGHAADATADLAAGVDLAAYGTAPPRFDPRELAQVQDRWLQALDAEAVNARRTPRGGPAVRDAVWLAIRGNLLEKRPDDTWAALPRLDALDAWLAILETPFRGVIADDDAADLALAADLLEDGADGGDAAVGWLDTVSARTGRRGRRLRLPIRLALTGRPDGPPLGDLLAILGLERSRRRLLGETA
ncbi:MAG: glutamate--tRNA ligase family protein [Pseudomonadota bacterium]